MTIRKKENISLSNKIVQKVRGMRDILPEEQKYFNYLRDIFENACEHSGFEKIYTPTIESINLFTKTVGKSTDIVEKEMYTFKDKSGNSVALRPEGTASIARAYLENGMTGRPQPVKLYYQLPMFRYDRPQAGRYREHWQFGVEALGEKSPLLDVTVIGLALRIINSAGLPNISLQINSIGCPTCRPKYQKALVEYIKNNQTKLCVDCKRRLKTNPLRILDCKVNACNEIAADAPQSVNHLCSPCHEHLRVILEYLDELDINYSLNSRLVRGLDYYTRTVFEIWAEGDDGKLTLGGGGRYDGLTALVGGKSVSGIGFGLGADRIVSELKKHDVELPTAHSVEVYVAQLGEEAKKKSFRLLFDLQQAGIGAEGSLEKGSISDQLKSANRFKVPFTLIIGQKEAFSDTVIIKDMHSGAQETYPRDKVVKEITRRLNKIK